MTYTEEEIECYTNILKNLKDGLNIYTPILDKSFHVKLQKRFHVKIVAIHIFSKIMVYLSVTNVFVLLVRCFIKDYTSKDRCYFQKKSIYNRSYHYQIIRLKEINKKYDLDIKPEVYFKLKAHLTKD